MSSQPSSSKPEGVSKCRYTTSALSKGTATLQEGITRGTMADDENNKTQAEEDRLLMPPPPRPAARQTRSSPQKGSPQKGSPRKTTEFTMTLRSQKKKNKNKDKPGSVAASTDTTTGTDATEANDNADSEKPEDGTKESEDDTKEQEDDLPPIKPLTEQERLLLPGIRINDPVPDPTWLFETMTPEEAELWRELAPQAGDRMLTVDEVDKLCDEFYKESRE
ncbi:uncharacterized protein NECHADRAFT_74091 [Fusarium vanettenii 77-13-4]|uniref:Uncharacterized protein n=1 Tax=Fusarium vanettenii (strain ATCC MYA-4622 / CBS 123669 / FGSC 9596 / NRRL 45880 / 77-13-4) TaxID=660122 RepID=C7YVV6_FUSV7|nr:uncharacterized protein NECHADRAFT_74091 [Fusarium vanettenii 77-13-4]EEU44067.1 predicted protein [Fusarium vanettenii 77-13-4]